MVGPSFRPFSRTSDRIAPRSSVADWKLSAGYTVLHGFLPRNVPLSLPKEGVSVKSSGADEVLEGVMAVKIHHEQGVFRATSRTKFPGRWVV